jgi:hypothetical protein
MVIVRPYPPAYNGSPEVRSVAVDKDSVLLQVRADKGSVHLGIANNRIQEKENRGRAIVDVVENGFVESDVVNKVIAGPGVIVDEVEEGVFSVSAESVIGTEIDLNTVALSGVYVGTSNANATVYTFPENVTSSMTGSIRIPYLGESSVKASVCILLEGAGSTSALSTLAVTVQPTSPNVVNKATPVSYSISNVSAIDPSKLYRIQVALSDKQKVNSNDMLFIKLSAVSPASTTKVVAVSVMLDEVV